MYCNTMGKFLLTQHIIVTCDIVRPPWVITLGTQTSHFLPQCWKYRTVTDYRVIRVRVSILEHVLSLFNEATCLFLSDPKTYHIAQNIRGFASFSLLYILNKLCFHLAHPNVYLVRICCCHVLFVCVLKLKEPAYPSRHIAIVRIIGKPASCVQTCCVTYWFLLNFLVS